MEILKGAFQRFKWTLFVDLWRTVGDLRVTFDILGSIFRSREIVVNLPAF